MELLNYYYNNLGEYPTQENRNTTQKTIEYLIDCGLSQEAIVEILNTVGHKHAITYDDLPDILWEGSLLNRTSFYYHGELRLTSPPPTWNSESKFYLEMKINYTEDMALYYFFNKFKVNTQWVDENKERGAFKYLIKMYSKLDFVQSIDMFLYLCDYTFNNSKSTISTLYDMRQYEIDAMNMLQQEVKHAKFVGTNKIIRR